MSADTKWIIGTIVVVAGLLSAQIGGQIGGLDTRIDDLRADVTRAIVELRTDVRGIDTRLRAVEVALGKVDQRLETLERLHLPGPGAGEAGPGAGER